MTGTRIRILALLLVTGACTPGHEELTVVFEAAFDGERIDCGSPSAAGRLTDLRFYVSDVRLVADGGEEIGVSLRSDGRWQGDGVALIDLEDGTGACENGSPGTNAAVVVRAPRGSYRGLRFAIGVPFAMNHRDPLAAAPPLNDSAMHWHWRSGYKFLRAGVESDGRHHWLHLGSAGCEGTIRSITHCRFPNRVSVALENYVPGDAVAIDLAALFDAFSASPDPSSSCSSGPAEGNCGPAFAVLGLDHETGEQVANQRLVQLAR